MNIYIRLGDLEQRQLLEILPVEHSVAKAIRLERFNIEQKVIKPTHEEISLDVETYVGNGGSIHHLPPDPRPGSLRGHRNGVRRKKSSVTLSSFKGVDKDVLMEALKRQLASFNQQHAH